MRRLYIIRKDLNMSSGKLAAMIAHCTEAYWTNKIRCAQPECSDNDAYKVNLHIEKNEYENYVKGKFVKTICEAKNYGHLMKAVDKALELGLVEDTDFGLITDDCTTELESENEDGTCTVGVWFKPLADETSHLLSKKYQLYKNERRN